MLVIKLLMLISLINLYLMFYVINVSTVYIFFFNRISVNKTISIQYLISFFFKYDKHVNFIKISFISFFGLPPFFLFFIKFNILVFLFYNINFFLLVFVFFFFFFNIIFYLQFFFFNNMSYPVDIKPLTSINYKISIVYIFINFFNILGIFFFFDIFFL